MAEILITLNNPPNNCHECKNGWCDLWEQNINMTTGKHPDCPMKELPPHGDLIDANAVEEEAREIQSKGRILYKDAIWRAFDGADVVVEASKETEAR